jgi:hypothetical protein
MGAAGDEAGEVGHVDHQERVHLSRDLRKGREVEDARVGAVAGDDHLGTELEGALPYRLHVEDARRLVDEIRLEVIDLAAEADRGAVAEVAALVERHAEHPVAWGEDARVDRHVGLGPGVRLDVRVLGAEERLGAVAGQVLHLVDDLAAAVVPLAGNTLGVLVVEPGSQRLEHGHRREVLGRDEL